MKFFDEISPFLRWQTEVLSDGLVCRKTQDSVKVLFVSQDIRPSKVGEKVKLILEGSETNISKW